MKGKYDYISNIEEAVRKLQKARMISVDENGEINIVSESFFDSYAGYVICNMSIWEESLENFIRTNPEAAGRIKAKLLSLPAPCIIKRRLVVLFLMFFRDDENEDTKNKILDIKSFIENRETWEMDPSFFQEWLESEIKIFIYFSRMAILNYPLGIVWRSDVLSWFEGIGYQEEDIQNRLSDLCSVRFLFEYINGTFAVWEVECGIWNKINKISSIQLPECTVL